MHAAYLQASSFSALIGLMQLNMFAQVANGWPALNDGTMSATQRYQFSLMRYGDVLWKGGDACELTINIRPRSLLVIWMKRPPGMQIRLINNAIRPRKYRRKRLRLNQPRPPPLIRRYRHPN